MVSSNSICDKDNTITSQTQLSLMNLEREADTKGQLLTLLWYPQGLTVGHHHLMQHTSELVEHSEALLFPNTRVVEAWQPGLQQTEGQPSRPALLPAANTWAQHGGGDTLWSWTKEGEFRLASSGSARLALKPPFSCPGESTPSFWNVQTNDMQVPGGEVLLLGGIWQLSGHFPGGFQGPLQA